MNKFELSFKVADVLAIGFELVIEETKKLKKISNRFEAEFKLLQELKNSVELKQEIEVTCKRCGKISKTKCHNLKICNRCVKIIKKENIYVAPLRSQ